MRMGLSNTESLEHRSLTLLESHRQVKDPPPGFRVSEPSELSAVSVGALFPLLSFNNSWKLPVSGFYSVTGELDLLHILPAVFTRASPRPYCF